MFSCEHETLDNETAGATPLRHDSTHFDVPVQGSGFRDTTNTIIYYTNQSIQELACIQVLFATITIQGFRVKGSGIRVKGSGLRVQGSGLRVKS